MSFIAAEIPDGIVYGLLPVVLALIVALIAYIVKTVARIDSRSAVTERIVQDHETDISRLDDRLRSVEMRRYER